MAVSHMINGSAHSQLERRTCAFVLGGEEGSDGKEGERTAGGVKLFVTTKQKAPVDRMGPTGAKSLHRNTEAEGFEPPCGCPRRISSALPYQLGLRLLIYQFSRDGRI